MPGVALQWNLGDSAEPLTVWIHRMEMKGTRHLRYACGAGQKLKQIMCCVLKTQLYGI